MLVKAQREAPTIEINGELGLLDISGALYLPSHDALLIADLHLEKGSSFAKRGMFIPPYDTRETLRLLQDVLARLNPRLVVALGDSFHDSAGPERLGLEERQGLFEAQRGRDWLWLTGNHDPVLSTDIGGDIACEHAFGCTILRHEPQEIMTGEISGHLHPVGKVAMRGRNTRRRCFVTDGLRCILPAFGAYAGGLNVCDDVFKPLFPIGFTAYVIGAERIYGIGKAQLCRD